MDKTKEQIWWDSLTEDVKDSINHSVFYNKVLNIEKAYALLNMYIR